MLIENRHLLLYMSLLEQQKFLAILYTDQNVRWKFIADAKKIGHEYKLTDEEIAYILEILPEEINAFATSLFHKRLREVEKFLPLTKIILGKEFSKLFNDFSQTFTPTSVKKHLEDAIEFANYLQTSKSNSDLEKDVAKLEGSKLEFVGFDRNFIVRKFGYDVRGIIHRKIENQDKLNKRFTIGFWLKFGEFQKHFFI